ncbi:hypothetical protein KAS50_03400, partial [bacterium]|nr:hypothetical protein [bacterium]
TNIKLEVLDFDSLTTLHSQDTASPSTECDGLKYNCTAEEFEWYDNTVRSLPDNLKNAAVIASAARGASGGLVGSDNTLIEVPGKGLTLAYTQEYPDEVEERFREIAGSEKDFFLETGSIRNFPGSLTLVKRLLFEEMERPALLEKAEAFAAYGILMAGHFLGDDFLKAGNSAGNIHGYWTCHSGARNINEKPGTPSRCAERIESFFGLIPREPSSAYKPIGIVPPEKAASLGLTGEVLVIPGEHDTCISHIPIMSTFYQAFPVHEGKPVIHVDAGTWTMTAQIGGEINLPEDGYKKGILVQGTVDGEPVVTAIYGGGSDFKFIKGLIEEKGLNFNAELNENLLEQVIKDADCFVLPNINPNNYHTGPFPELKGKIINENKFYENRKKAYIMANRTTAITTAFQIETIVKDKSVPVVLTAGGSKDPYFGRLLASLTNRKVFAMYDRTGSALSETTTLGAAIIGKAACLNIHPYKVDLSSLGVSYKELKPFDAQAALSAYKEKFLKEVEMHSGI